MPVFVASAAVTAVLVALWTNARRGDEPATPAAVVEPAPAALREAPPSLPAATLAPPRARVAPATGVPQDADASAEERLDELKRLRAQRHPDLLDVAVAALEDPDARLRSAAADALGVLGDARAASALARALDVEEDPAVRTALVRSIALLESRAVRGFDPDRIP